MAEEEKVAEPAAEELKKATSKELPYKGKLKGMKELAPGMTVKVHEKIKDVSSKGEERERIQIFEGMILAIRGAGLSRTMTVRKMSDRWAVEKIYPVSSPVIDHIELVKSAKVRRSKLNYMARPRVPFNRKLKEKKA